MQIYTYPDLIEVLNRQDHVTALPIDTKVFKKNMDLFLNKFYKNPPPGSILIKQMFFSVHDSNSGVFSTQTCAGEEAVERNLKKGGAAGNRIDKMTQDFQNLPFLLVPGVKPIKQVELWKKWGLNVPPDKQEEMCPKPSQEVIDLVSNSRKEKANKNKSKAVKLAGLKKKGELLTSNNEGEETSSEPALKRKRKSQMCSHCGKPGRKDTCPCQNQQAATVPDMSSSSATDL
jgi:hypothetical protein